MTSLGLLFHKKKLQWPCAARLNRKQLHSVIRIRKNPPFKPFLIWFIPDKKPIVLCQKLAAFKALHTRILAGDSSHNGVVAYCKYASSILNRGIPVSNVNIALWVAR